MRSLKILLVLYLPYVSKRLEEQLALFLYLMFVFQPLNNLMRCNLNFKNNRPVIIVETQSTTI